MVALVPGQAHAANECGADVPGPNTVTCANASYPGAITYIGSTGLTLNLENPVLVVTAAGSYAIIVQSSAINTNDVVLNANNLTSVTAALASAVRVRGLNGKGVVNIHGGTFTSGNTVQGTISVGGAGAEAALHGGLVTTSGASNTNIGMAVQGAAGGASLLITGGGIDMGAGGTGASVSTTAASTATLQMTGGTVIAGGSGGDGIFVSSTGGGAYNVNVSGGTITSGSGNGAGIHASAVSGGVIDIGAGAVVNGGASGVAIREGDADKNGVDEINSNTTITTAGTLNGSILLGGGTDAVTVTGGAINGHITGDGADSLDFALGSGTFVYDAAYTTSGMNAVTMTSGTARIDGTINTNTLDVLGGALRINGTTTTLGGATVRAGGTLGGTGTIVGNVTNSGIIAPGNSIGTLTINGNYISNGGTLAVEAELGGDASPADLLLINGNSLLGLAPTLVQVTNVGGVGGVATNGIKIVDVVGATSDAGVFVLSGPVIGGAYAYQLFQNDLATGTDGDWYLRSAGLAPTTPTFESYPVALLGMTDLPTLRQRVGDRVEAADGVWSRIQGASGHYQANSSNAGASYDSSLFLAQFGVEGALVDSPDGSLVAGFSAQYSRNSAAVFSGYGNGSNVTEAVGIGATLTWRGAEGTYLDLQGQLAKFWTDLDAIGYRLVSDNGGAGLAVSLEAGHKIALDDAWAITPQAQLSYASVGFDSFTDRFGSVISLEAGNSLKGRVGVAIDYRTDWQDEQGGDASASLNGVASLTYEFLDGATVAVSGTNLHYVAQKFGGELGLGGTLEWNGGAQALHAEVLGATSFQGSYAVKGTVGFTAGF